MPGYRPLQENALEELRKRLAAGEFAPGVVYSESRIASELGISRTPVKDALVRLAQDRYIDILPSRGFRLHEMSDQDVQETFQLRTAIEGFCAISLARERGTDAGKEKIALMQKSLESMRVALAAGADGAVGDEFLASDLAFHRTLVAFSKNEELMRLFDSYQHRLSMVAETSLLSPGRPAEAIEEQQSIFDAIASGEDDGMGAYRAVEHHMRSARDIVLAGRGQSRAE